MPRKSLPPMLKTLSVLSVKLTKTTEEDLWKQFVEGYEQVLSAYEDIIRSEEELLNKYIHGNPFDTERYDRAFYHLHNRRGYTGWKNSNLDMGDKSPEELMCPRPHKEGHYINLWTEAKQTEYFHTMDLVFDYAKLGGILKWGGRPEFDEFQHRYEKLKTMGMKKDELKYYENLRYEEALAKWKKSEEGRHFARGMTCLENCSFCEKDKQKEEERRKKYEEYKRKEEEERKQWSSEEEQVVEVPVVPEPPKSKLPSGPQVCEACNYKTIHPYFFKQHMESKEHERNARQKSLFCETCSHQSRNETEHQFHIGTKKHKIAVGDVEKDPKVFECETCGYSTPTKQCYLVHMNSKKHKLATGELEPTGPKVYTCELCQYSSHRKQNLAIHLISNKHLRKVQEQR
jgi:hypothetical protein